MKKKLLIVGLIILLIGIFLFITGLIINNKKETNKKLNVELLVFDFKYEEMTDEDGNQGLNLNFILLNNGEIELKNKNITIKFYDDNKLIHTLEYKIESLASKKEMNIEYQEMFTYSKISNYEISYDNKKMKVLDYDELKNYTDDDSDDSDYQEGKSKLNISNFNVTNIEEGIELSFEINNVGEETIKNEPLKVNFYKDNELINSFEHVIEELTPESTQNIDVSLEINSKDFDKYEIIYNDDKLDIE